MANIITGIILIVLGASGEFELQFIGGGATGLYVLGGALFLWGALSLKRRRSIESLVEDSVDHS